MVRIDFKLADIKVESSEVYLLKLGKICVRFGRCLHFLVKMWFKMYADISKKKLNKDKI